MLSIGKALLSISQAEIELTSKVQSIEQVVKAMNNELSKKQI